MNHSAVRLGIARIALLFGIRGSEGLTNVSPSLAALLVKTERAQRHYMRIDSEGKRARASNGLYNYSACKMKQHCDGVVASTRVLIGATRCTVEMRIAMILDELTQLKRERSAILLAHNYQPGEIQEAADYVGDSFELSKTASQSDRDVIVFCGVDFMAESAAILSPHKTVLLPVLEASCPMSHMITAADVRQLRAEHPEATVVCYVNTSAAVKAESDICCTSANAIRVVNAVDTDQIIFVPDRNLAHYVQMWTEKELIAWDGYCPTHENITLQDIEARRRAMPDIEVVVHPECRPEVIEAADFVHGTSGMLRHAKASTARRLLIGTEMGMLYRLQKENPGKEFYPPSARAVCPNMKLTTLEAAVGALEKMRYRVTVDENIRLRAKKALEMMLQV